MNCSKKLFHSCFKDTDLGTHLREASRLLSRDEVFFHHRFAGCFLSGFDRGTLWAELLLNKEKGNK